MSRHRLPDRADEAPGTAAVPSPREPADDRSVRSRTREPAGALPDAAAESVTRAADEPGSGGRRPPPSRHRTDQALHGRAAHDRAAAHDLAPDIRAADDRAAADRAADDRAPDDAALPSRGRHGKSDNRPRRARLTAGRRTAMVMLAVAVGVVALPSAGSASVDQCRWQVAAHELLVSLDGRTDIRSVRLRMALKQAGIDKNVPAECAGSTPGGPAIAPTTKPTSTPTTTAPVPPAAAPTPTSGAGTTAAQVFGWGTPNRSDDFSGDLSQWGLYDGTGNDGNGRRTPSAVSVANGIMTITGSADGDTDGMAWGSGQKYGRWEARVRSTAGDENYHPVLLLWPDAENWPVGGEIDWMEISDPTRRTSESFLHYGRSNNQVQGNVDVDATQWHNWAVEWTPKGVTTYLDGKSWWSTTDTSILPPGPMHMTIQLDNFGGSSLTPSQMQVDWVRQYKA